MVNTLNLSAYDGVPPECDDRKRNRIGEKPLYAKEAVLSILRGEADPVILWTDRCIKNVGSLDWGPDDVVRLVQGALNDGTYLNSSWCSQGANGNWAACDAYRVMFEEWAPHLHQMRSLEYYLKFAISRTGKVVLIVSCHLSG